MKCHPKIGIVQIPRSLQDVAQTIQELEVLIRRVELADVVAVQLCGDVPRNGGRSDEQLAIELGTNRMTQQKVERKVGRSEQHRNDDDEQRHHPEAQRAGTNHAD